MKAKTMFYCTECGNELPKWAGQCPACKAWNTIVERPAETKRRSAPAAGSLRIISSHREAQQPSFILNRPF